MTRSSQKYIGGEFSTRDRTSIIQPESYSDFEFYFPAQIGERKLVYKESGADSIAQILQSLDKPAFVLWVPHNFCHETIDRVNAKLPNVHIERRKYLSTADIQTQDEKFHIALLVHYNGYSPEVSSFAEGQIGDKLITIEDFTHAPLEINVTKANFSFASLRKFVPISISVTYGFEERSASNVEESAYLKIRKTAMEIKARALDEELFCSESVYLNLFKLAEEQLQIPRIQSAQSLEVETFHKINFKELKAHRKRNFDWLNEEIDGSVVINKILTGSYMYFICEFESRDKVRAQFFEKGIFPAIHWAGSSCGGLSFHIDQRFGLEDMLRIKRAMEGIRI